MPQLRHLCLEYCLYRHLRGLTLQLQFIVLYLSKGNVLASYTCVSIYLILSTRTH